MNRSPVLLAIGLSVGVVLGWWLHRFHDIDRCLDHGGRWRYDESSCEGASKY